MNPGRTGRFAVTVSYTLAVHRTQPTLSAAVPVDGHARAPFSWGEGDARYAGERITSCAGSVARDTIRD